MKTNAKPAFLYAAKSILGGCIIFFCIIVAIVIGCVILSLNVPITADHFSFSGFGVAIVIFLFVLGIVQPRPNLRLCAQMGISRRTSFWCTLAVTIVAALLLAVAGEIVITAGQVIGREGLYMTDLYPLIYLANSSGWNMMLSLPQHLISILFNTLLMCLAFCGGMFFTYLFWRLNKAWTIVVAICIPVALNVVPFLIRQIPGGSHVTAAFFSWLLASVWNLLIIFVLLSVVLCIISWLLVRRANIKAPTGRK